MKRGSRPLEVRVGRLLVPCHGVTAAVGCLSVENRHSQRSRPPRRFAMSVQALSWVFDHSKSRGNGRLVLLSIANHARKDGSGAWPSDASIAEESGLGTRTVRRLINETLEPSGELVIARRPGRSNLYDLPLVREGNPGQNGRPTESAPRPETAPTPANTGRPPRPILAAEPSLTVPMQPSQTLARIKPRARDELWEAVIESIGSNPGTKAERASWNAAVKEMREANWTPEIVRAVAAAFRRQWSHLTMTPHALSKRGAVLLAEAQRRNGKASSVAATLGLDINRIAGRT